jgi:hypothetical protein
MKENKGKLGFIENNEVGKGVYCCLGSDVGQVRMGILQKVARERI